MMLRAHKMIIEIYFSIEDLIYYPNQDHNQL
jgi:hypothetical protein